MGCFEDYMDFREEVDRIKMKDRVKEEAKCPCSAYQKTKAPSNLKAPEKAALLVKVSLICADYPGLWPWIPCYTLLPSGCI